MNHQVQRHRDVGAARLERGEPLDLEETWLVEIRPCGPHRAVEPLHVPHLQHHARSGRPPHELLGVAHGVGQRLLDERRDAPLQDFHAYGRVCRCGDDDRCGFDAFEQRLEVRKGGGLELLGNVGRAGGVGA